MQFGLAPGSGIVCLQCSASVQGSFGIIEDPDIGTISFNHSSLNYCREASLVKNAAFFQEILAKIASAGAFAWRISRALEIPHLQIARKRGSASSLHRKWCILQKSSTGKLAACHTHDMHSNLVPGLHLCATSNNMHLR